MQLYINTHIQSNVESICSSSIFSITLDTSSLLPFIRVRKSKTHEPDWAEQMTKEHTELWKMRRWRAFPPNLETKEEWNNTASGTY